MTGRRRDTVLALLRPWHDGSASLVSEASLGHDWAPVTRLTFDRDLPGIGRTAVVKTRRTDGAGHGGPAHLRREEAALRTAAPAGVTARLIAADQADGVVVTTDLGDWPTLEAVLLGADADAAARAVVEFGIAVGRLHAGTGSAGERYRQALADLGAPETDAGPGLPWPGVDRWQEPYSTHWATLPAAVVDEADRAYRRELAATMPADVLVHLDEALAVGAAAALAVRVQRLPLLAAAGQPSPTRRRRRAQLVQQIGVFTRLAERAGTLPAMAEWFARLASAMTARWRDATTPPPATFPAFRSARNG
ncbi:hypothetical protein ACQP2P_26450 [Dactylosporangium sp. CA-139114]|uniref:hypothetical protein n=1 Tax=Dactylosporangium sp. CA-139114 TaxID=3239931 RepID=UPI003D970D1C